MDNNLIFEEWRDIFGYEGYYQVSSLGRVRSLPRKVVYNSNGDLAQKKGKILKLRTGGSSPYLVIGLHKDNVRTNYFVHRLVAKAFIPNPNNYETVNHRNENKLDNTVINLEWCTQQYNNRYGSRMTEGKNKRKVYQIDKNTGEILNEFCSMREAERQTGIGSGNIGVACKSENKTAGGYKWRYKDITVE